MKRATSWPGVVASCGKPITSKPEPHLRLTRGEETDPQASQSVGQATGQAVLAGTEEGGAEDLVEAGFRARRRRGALLVRWTVLLLSAGGVIAAAWLWHGGHGGLGLRLIADDVLVLTAIVLLL